MISIDKNHKIISQIILSGNYKLVSNINLSTDKTVKEIILDLKRESEVYKEKFKISEKIISGFLNNNVIKKNIQYLISIELYNDGISSTRFNKLITDLISFDINDRINKFLIFFVRKSKTIQNSLNNFEKNKNIFLILKKINSEFKYDFNV